MCIIYFTVSYLDGILYFKINKLNYMLCTVSEYIIFWVGVTFMSITHIYIYNIWEWTFLFLNKMVDKTKYNNELLYILDVLYIIDWLINK